MRPSVLDLNSVGGSAGLSGGRYLLFESMWYMSINLIRVDDSTDHDGKVKTGSSSMKFGGCYVAQARVTRWRSP